MKKKVKEEKKRERKERKKTYTNNIMYAHT